MGENILTVTVHYAGNEVGRLDISLSPAAAAEKAVAHEEGGGTELVETVVVTEEASAGGTEEEITPLAAEAGTGEKPAEA